MVFNNRVTRSARSGIKRVGFRKPNRKPDVSGVIPSGRSLIVVVPQGIDKCDRITDVSAWRRRGQLAEPSNCEDSVAVGVRRICS